MMNKRELLFADMPVGRVFKPFVYPITKEGTAKFIDTVQDNNPLYCDEQFAKSSIYGALIAPQAVAGIYSRLSYLGDEYSMPGGGVLTGLDFHFINPPKVGDTLTSLAKVVKSEQRSDRKFVKFEVNTSNQTGQPISIVYISAIWPK